MTDTETSDRRIVVSEDVVGPAIQHLNETFNVHTDASLWQSPEKLIQQASRADALIVRNRTEISRELLGAADRLTVVGRAGAGLDNVDVQAATENDVLVCYAPVQNATSVAEHTMALILGLLRNVARADASVRDGEWERHEHTGHELAGRTLGVVGLGTIGRKVAGYGQAFGMTLLAHDPYVKAGSDALEGLDCWLLSMDVLLSRADIITVHVPLTHETRHLIDRTALRRMNSHAVLINSSRGGVVNEDDLCEALKDEQIAGAALDVRENEPPSPDSPLHEMPQTLLTPHIAAFTTEAQNAVVQAVVDDVINVLKGNEPEYCANFSRQ